MDGLKEIPLLLNQVMLELKDSRSFRVSAQRARAKETPNIPKSHEEMDPEKVNSFCCDKRESWKTPSGVFNFICLFHNNLIFCRVGLKDLVLGRRSSPDMKNKDLCNRPRHLHHRQCLGALAI